MRNGTHLVGLLVGDDDLGDGEPVAELLHGLRGLVPDAEDVLAELVAVHLLHDAVVRLALARHHVSHGGRRFFTRGILRLLGDDRGLVGGLLGLFRGLLGIRLRGLLGLAGDDGLGGHAGGLRGNRDANGERPKVGMRIYFTERR